MEILGLLIGISLVVIGLVIWLFFRMSSGGQFEDLEAPARRILLDDDRPVPPQTDKTQTDKTQTDNPSR